MIRFVVIIEIEGRMCGSDSVREDTVIL